MCGFVCVFLGRRAVIQVEKYAGSADIVKCWLKKHFAK